MAKKNPDEKIDNIPGEGNVEFELNGEAVTLRPTLQACLGISRLHNSMQQTIDKIWAMDMDTIVSVTSLGLGKPADRKLQQDVFKTGLFSIRSPLMKFITIVNNGGRPFTEEDGDTEDDEDENPPIADQAL